MFERAGAAKPFPLQLRADGSQRILAPQGDPILGWLGDASAGVAQPLTVPGKLLAPKPTSRLVYACNLPAGEEGPAAFAELPTEIGRGLEDGFAAESLPGGQTAIVTRDGKEAVLQFRWICLTSKSAAGAVWRCYVRIGGNRSGAWRAIGHDYLFDAGGGSILNPPGPLAITGFEEYAAQLTLEHPEEKLTSFPCSLGRVKVTRLTADGWPARHVLGITLQDDNRIAAFFSDGRREIIATAAPSSRRAARAAA